MCTLCVAFYPGTSNPFVIAANRDENPNRPAMPWEERLFDEDQYRIRVYCPQDVLGGTWIGCNSFGFFAAITNWDLNMDLHGQGMKSRGLLLLDILKRNNFYNINELFESINPESYKPFNILVGRLDTLINYRCDHERKSIHVLPAGFHVSTGLGMNTGCVRETFLRKELARKFNNFSQPIHPDDLLQCMSAHNDGIGSDDSVCVHDSDHRWETRSSSGIVFSGSEWRVRHTNGPPCITPVIDHWDSYTLRLR